ncbi:MAG: hypothetical protein R3C68_13180 [Myxococcota bacterium]
MPADFGAINGTPIANKSTILKNLWRSLGHEGPPSLVYLYIKPYSFFKFSGDSGSGSSPFGHSGIGYYDAEEGRMMLMNVVGTEGEEMIHFLPLEDYLYSVKPLPGMQEGGVYNRGMIMGATWDIEPQKFGA